MRLPEALRALRSRDFRAFFGVPTISQIGTWMHSVAQAADRVAKRRLLMVTQAAQACAVLTVATLVATGAVAYWHIGILALGAGVAWSVSAAFLVWGAGGLAVLAVLVGARRRRGLSPVMTAS